VAEEEPQEDVHEEVPGAGASNRTLFIIMAVVAAIFVIGGIALGKKKPEEGAEPPLPPGNARALVLPTDDSPRTVVVAPCGTDPKESADDAREDRATPNTVRLEFPRGGGDRALLVPDCSPKAGVSGSNSGLPTAAFILPAGTKENSLQVPPLRAESQALVPQGGKAKTVVISPCTGQIGGEAGRPAPSREGGANQDAVLEPEAGQGDLVVAPLC
jgi:hypothetical protein